MIIPQWLIPSIDQLIDEQLLEHPDAAEFRSYFRSKIMDYYKTHGELPSFKIQRNKRAA